MTVTTHETELTEEAAWEALESVRDPEIPVVSVVELGVVRRLEVHAGSVKATLTPTFAGCPALEVMRAEVEARLRECGYAEVEVEFEYDPPWTSDGLSEATKTKLRQFGLSPPPRHAGNVLLVLDSPAVCPYCGSSQTSLKNSFGSTLCRSIHYCQACNQPFEGFKPL